MTAINPLIKDAMRRAGQNPPANGEVRIGDGTTVVQCSVGASSATLSPADRQLRMNVRNFLMTATLDELKKELAISKQRGYAKRAQFIQEMIDEEGAGASMKPGKAVGCANGGATAGTSGVAPKDANRILAELKKIDAAIRAIQKIQDPDRAPATNDYRQAFYKMTDGFWTMKDVLGAAF